METDVRFAAVSRKPAFTIRVPTAYFADYHAASGTGVLITQQIAFGENGIEPHRAKCLDHELADSLPYYRALITALARLAGPHLSARLPPRTDARREGKEGVSACRSPWSAYLQNKNKIQ